MLAMIKRMALQLSNGLIIGLLGAAVVGGLGGLLAGTAQGYVLEGPHVLALMAGNLSGAPTLRVEQQVTIEDPAVSGEPVVLSETLNFIFPGQFRSDTVHQDSRRIQVVSKGQTMTIVDNKITATIQAPYDSYKDLLLNNTAQLLQITLARHGVDVGICSLGRQADQVAFVIGAQYPDESVSQLWVDQERFLPLRWLTVKTPGRSGDNGESWEFDYTAWQKVDGVYYPFRIETLHNGQPIRLIQVSKVDANAVIDSAMFDIAHLQSLYQVQEQPAASGKTSAPDVEDVQRTIEEFKKKFEP
jgi:outer membrane lipoprotein-sorting protein